MPSTRQIVARAKADKQRIVLPEAEEERTLKAADKVLADDIADIILIGNPANIKNLAAQWGLNNIDKATIKETIMPIVMACMSMSKKYVGALLVIERGVPLKDIMDTGEEIDAKINQRLIENIFFKNSPLHDGAMVISNKRIMSAGCILPVSHNLDIPKELGLRHRAALGISQSSDAIAVIVSEETGRISVAIKGEFRLRLSAEELESILTQEMM